MDQEKQEFVKKIHEILKVLPKQTTIRDVAKKFRDLEGKSINPVVEKLEGRLSLASFIRHNCQSFCDIYWTRYTHEPDVKVVRTEEHSIAQKKSKKKPKSKVIPKLNNPRVGILNTSSFRRSNPQGVNKNKPKNPENKPLSSLSHYRSNPCLSYRSANQLETFHFQDGDEDGADDVNYEFNRDRLYKSFADALNQTADEGEKNEEPPSVQNPNDFPSLPNISCDTSTFAGSHSDCDADVNDSDDHVSDSKSHEVDTIKNMLRELDDPIFRSIYPDVVTDPNTSIPKPKIVPTASKHFFEIHITKIYSPSQFYFQYGDESLYVLMNRIRLFYEKIPEDDLIISEDNMQPGLVVVVKAFDIWHRAEIALRPDKSGNLVVNFVDFGMVEEVPSSNLRYLLKAFSYDPVKALKGSMTGAVPKNNKHDWDSKTRQKFFDLVADKKLYAALKNPKLGKEVHELEIFEQIKSSSTVADKMVQVGLADTIYFDDMTTYGVPSSVGY